MGRFMTPDWSSAPMGVPYANFGDPQSLNLYAYVRNNPLSHADADGHCDPDGRHCLWQKLKNDLLYNHFVTDANLNSALTNDAATMRQRIAAEHLKAGNQSLNMKFLNTLSNQQVMDIGLQLALINVEGGDDAIPTEGPEQGESTSSSSSGPKPSPNFVTPTNPPQEPPSELAPGHSVRVMPPTEQYPNGYWVETNEYGQPVDPSTGRPPSNVTSAEGRAQTHVPLPPK